MITNEKCIVLLKDLVEPSAPFKKDLSECMYVIEPVRVLLMPCGLEKMSNSCEHEPGNLQYLQLLFEPLRNVL